MAAFVLDASATLPWCFRDEQTPFTDDLLMRMAAGTEVLVAAHWPMEVLNVLVQASRRGRISAVDADSFLNDLASFKIQVEVRPYTEHMVAVRALAELHGLTSYDAAYLELAKRNRLPLASLDKQLCRAAQKEGVPLLG